MCNNSIESVKKNKINEEGKKGKKKKKCSQEDLAGFEPVSLRCRWVVSEPLA